MGQTLRLRQTWEIAAWEIAHLGSYHMGKYPWEVVTWEESFGKVPNTEKRTIQLLEKKLLLRFNYLTKQIYLLVKKEKKYLSITLI